MEENKMKPYIIAGIVVGIIALVFAGCAVAETIMYPDDDGVENVTVDLNNASDHVNSTTVLVKKDPKGILHNLFKQKEKVNKYGIMEYNGGLWIKNPNGVWVRVALINSNGQVTQIFTNNFIIINNICKCYTTVNNVEIFDHDLNSLTGNGTVNASDVTTNNTTTVNNNMSDAVIESIIANTTAEELGVNASDVVLDDNMTDNMTENDTNITDDMDMDSGDEFYYDDSGYDDYYYDDEYYYDDYY